MSAGGVYELFRHRVGLHPDGRLWGPGEPSVLCGCCAEKPLALWQLQRDGNWNKHINTCDTLNVNMIHVERWQSWAFLFFQALATACWSVLKAKRRLLMVSLKWTDLRVDLNFRTELQYTVCTFFISLFFRCLMVSYHTSMSYRNTWAQF